MIPTERHRPYLVPGEDVARRIEALRSAMHSADVAVAWIDHLADRLYFTGSAQDGVLIVPAEGPAIFHVRKSLDRARAEASVDVQPYPGAKVLFGEVGRAAGAAGHVGLAMDVTPASTYARLLRHVGIERIVDLATTVRTIRSVKSCWEVEQIRKASDQVTTLYAEIGERIRPGMTELDLNGCIESRFREMGPRRPPEGAPPVPAVPRF